MWAMSLKANSDRPGHGSRGLVGDVDDPSRTTRALRRLQATRVSEFRFAERPLGFQPCMAPRACATMASTLVVARTKQEITLTDNDALDGASLRADIAPHLDTRRVHAGDIEAVGPAVGAEGEMRHDTTVFPRRHDR
jgi:hypothetical protein